MTDYELWYALLDNGTLTLGFAKLCLLFTLTHLACKFKPQNNVLRLVFRMLVLLFAALCLWVTLPADYCRVYSTLANKLSDRPFASELQLSRAIEYFSRAISSGHWNNTLLRDYAGTLVRAGRGSEAAQLLGSGPWNSAATPELLVPYSRALLAAGQTTQALQIASAALQSENEFDRFWAIRTIAEAYIAKNEYNEAAKFLETCLPGLTDAATKQLLTEKIKQIRQGKPWIENQ